MQESLLFYRNVRSCVAQKCPTKLSRCGSSYVNDDVDDVIKIGNIVSFKNCRPLKHTKRKSFKRGRAQIILKCHFDATILLWQGSSYTFAVKIDALSHPVWQELTKLWPPWQLFKVIGLFCCLGKNYSTLSASVQNVLG